MPPSEKQIGDVCADIRALQDLSDSGNVVDGLLQVKSDLDQLYLRGIQDIQQCAGYKHINSIQDVQDPGPLTHWLDALLSQPSAQSMSVSWLIRSIYSYLVVTSKASSCIAQAVTKLNTGLNQNDPTIDNVKYSLRDRYLAATKLQDCLSKLVQDTRASLIDVALHGLETQAREYKSLRNNASTAIVNEFSQSGTEERRALVAKEWESLFATDGPSRDKSVFRAKAVTILVMMQYSMNKSLLSIRADLESVKEGIPA
ncbi:hypothetical protein J1614_001572 [Plenodomus biglobosus]|nr:hypothetical protein J1614_001572 [Plenodomus biglobosus]